jgi:hypothetical protein
MTQREQAEQKRIEKLMTFSKTELEAKLAKLRAQRDAGSLGQRGINDIMSLAYAIERGFYRAECNPPESVYCGTCVTCRDGEAQ